MIILVKTAWFCCKQLQNDGALNFVHFFAPLCSFFLSTRVLELTPEVAINYRVVQNIFKAVYCWQPCFSGCRSSSLERSARGRRLIVIIADFPLSIKNSSFSTFIPSPDFWPFDWHRYSGPCSDVRYLSQSKKIYVSLTYQLIRDCVGL